MRNQVRAVTVSESEIQLTQGRWTLVDNNDLEELQKYKWFTQPSRSQTYAATKISYRRYYLHCLLLGLPSKEIDHANGNGLDNRRSNLRLSTRSQNGFNQKHVAGVYRTRSGSWQAQIVCYYKVYTATFKTKEEALEWRRQKARELYGEFAP
jgi:hypothetical protein